MTSVFTYPLGTVSARLMMMAAREKPVYSGMRDCMTQILKQEGPLAFYRGFPIKVITLLMGNIVMVAYERIMKRRRAAKKGE